MKYPKAPLSVDDQVAQLLERGMIGDPASMRRRLGVVSYYRLSGYWFHRKQSDGCFVPGTRFDVAWERYIFDRKLRLLLLDAIERIEVGLRTQFSYHHAHEHGPFGYAVNPHSLPKLGPSEFDKQLSDIRREVERSKEDFVTHFRLKYGDEHEWLPLWVATEVMSFGKVLTLWQASSNIVKNRVSEPFGVSDQVLRSWLWTLNEVRNVCAHHARLWNRELGNKPLIPHARHHPAWHVPTPIPNQRVYVALAISAHCLPRLAPSSGWRGRVRTLIADHPNIPILNMGFPEGWATSPLWQEGGPENV